MTWEAFIVIGVFTLALGALLLVPGLYLARRKLHKHQGSPAGRKLTTTGYIIVGTVVVVLLGGFAAGLVAPDTALGKLNQTSLGRLAYATLVAAAFWLVEVALNARGIKVKEKIFKNEEERI